MEYPQWIPKGFEFIAVRDTVYIPLIWQLLLLELAIDGLKLAAVNTPNMLSTPLSVMAALVLGEFSVKSGWFNSDTYPIRYCLPFCTLIITRRGTIEFFVFRPFFRLITVIVMVCFFRIASKI